jgi:DNA-binding NarL/FixJ family response regulator
MTPIRLLLVDDHALVRKGLAALLAADSAFCVVGEARDGGEAVKKTLELKPDLVLMDINMPGMGGLEATRRISKAVPSTKVVILTISEEDQDLFDAIKSGASGYLLKKVQPEELSSMLKGVLRGEAPISRLTAGRILAEFAVREHRPESAESGADVWEEELSRRETEVLRLVVEGLTNKEIGAKLGVEPTTVKNHLKNILGKLHLRNRVQAAAFALQKGLFPQLPGRTKPGSASS